MQNISTYRFVSFAILLVFLSISLVRTDLVQAFVTMVIISSLWIFSEKRPLPSFFYLLFPVVVLTYLLGSFGLYTSWYYYDKVVHILVSFASTLFIGYLLSETALKKVNSQKFLLSIVIISFGLSLGVFWEFFEWIVDFVYPQALIRGIDDTMTDLLADLLGAVLASIIALRFFKK